MMLISVTCVKPHSYTLFVASHTYVSGYTRDFEVHIAYNISCCLQAKNELNEYLR